MEQNKLKKLSLDKEEIVNLNDLEMSQINGGDGIDAFPWTVTTITFLSIVSIVSKGASCTNCEPEKLTHSDESCCIVN